jgi:hypothetical protein
MNKSGAEQREKNECDHDGKLLKERMKERMLSLYV